MERSKNRLNSFHFAVSGLNHAFYTQKNFQIQLGVLVIVFLLAWFFEFTRAEWILLIITSGLVLTAELLNTVIEVVVDLAVKEELIPEAKIAKDVAAASVLLMSAVAALVGALLFWPHLKELFYQT
jgi:diacylglycerol kinase